jgi:hypothetical protein
MSAVVVPLVNLFDFANAVEVESPFSNASFNGASVGYQKLETDPIGLLVITFDGIPAGIEIRVYDPELNQLAGIESCAEDQVLSWPVYTTGSSKNNVMIKLLSTEYKLKEFPFTSVVGALSIPVQMEPEPWYLNP